MVLLECCGRSAECRAAFLRSKVVRANLPGNTWGPAVPGRRSPDVWAGRFRGGKKGGRREEFSFSFGHVSDHPGKIFTSSNQMKIPDRGVPAKSPKPVRPGKKATARSAAALGPVEDLQSYVKADWWRHLFNANYLRTDGDVVEDERITSRELDHFCEILDPAPDARILDLCCGQGRHSLGLARRGFAHVTGLDRSHYLVTRARNIAKREMLGVTFREGDARKLPFATDRFDFVLVLGNSFGYFETLNDDRAVLREIRRILKPTGRLLLDLTDGDYMRGHYEPRSWEWIDKNYFVCRERCLSDDRSRLVAREVITHVRKGVVSDQFYAERLYSEEQMRGLLTECDFEEIAMREQVATESERNQDLGMMGRRLIYTAKPQKTWSVAVGKPAVVRRVAVVMGDPRKIDTVKPNGNFDEDDFSTIRRLREALGGIKGRKFTYFDNHDTFLGDLRKLRDEYDYVFNLCDEGFGNLPTRELHVPAALEMVGVRYTGGSPQCLAYCFDKSLVRGVAQEMDIPVPEAFMVRADNTSFYELTLLFPVIVKPNFGDSSVGITQSSVCHNIQQLEAAILDAHNRFGSNRPVLVERFLTGKDISVGMIGNLPDTLVALPVIEEDYTGLPEGLPKICGYEAKWDPSSPYWEHLRSVPAELSEETEAFLIASCQRLFERLGCRDYARFDWRLDDNGTPRLLEANPNPGWCWDGHLAKMAALGGKGYPEMLEMILEAAEERMARRS